MCPARKDILLVIRKFSPSSPWPQSYGWKRQEERVTATLESSLHSFCCSWHNFLKVKTPSVRAISKMQLQPGVWVHRGMSTDTTTHGLLTTSYLVCKSGRQVGRYHCCCFQMLCRYEFTGWIFENIILQMEQILGEVRLTICIAVTVESCT